MADYAELAKWLRICASDTVEDCSGCPYQGGYTGTYCMNGLISEASDAIEELTAFAHYVAREAFDEYEELSNSAFFELVCRKLYKLGIVEKDGAYWSYEPPKEDKP